MQGDDPATRQERLRSILRHVATGAALSEPEAEEAFGLIMDGVADDVQIAGLLMGMKARGETQDELLGAVKAVRSRMKALHEPPPDAIDVCGTGGDGHGTLNVSTSVAFVLAGLGVPVAKHGNRALSSKAGASDVLTALGVPLKDDVVTLGADLRERNLTFMAAPHHHPAMRHAAGVRRALGVRTLFNFVGPLANPACVTRQLVGVSDAAWLAPIVDTLAKLGSTRVWAVCGEIAGSSLRWIDEITLAGPTHVEALQDGVRHRFILEPEMAGLSPAPVSAIAGGGPEENAQALEALLRGSHGPYRDTVLFNAACGLHVAGRGQVLDAAGQVDGTVLRELVKLAASSIDSGAAFASLEAARGVTG
ncbi:anthranilate phosphoribosyltransferase [Acetobacter sp.]|uniref:anthranilate phosphoribosyltransferase n=1 Tax=Acetobacter sp. TaxID=440 RepID=UPI0025C1C6CE|nr:anthranilate phosphoribosyltransferase [Acetobacter sp.]MCH4090589.1 anthranilate phosphoribosyltransferase [Acetobacter sp.]MCI1300032.1 anthranilate phosphoribosyltransferase [Acetobacter sp.]MCI1316450.1 anthranilate phosphoribosyltransferase [Acetobacter sp.]